MLRKRCYQVPLCRNLRVSRLLRLFPLRFRLPVAVLPLLLFLLLLRLPLPRLRLPPHRL
jgi:hypothetical protein